MAVSQGVLSPTLTRTTQTPLTYYFMDQHVCRHAWGKLHGAGWWPRLSRILKVDWVLTSLAQFMCVVYMYAHMFVNVSICMPLTSTPARLF